MVNNEDLGRRIRAERKIAHMTIAELAETLDISISYMGLVERGERCLSVPKLVQLAGFFHVSIDYLINGINSYPELEYSDNELINELLNSIAFLNDDEIKKMVEIIFLYLRCLNVSEQSHTFIRNTLKSTTLLLKKCFL